MVLLDSEFNAAAGNYLRIDARAMFQPFGDDPDKFCKMLVTLRRPGSENMSKQAEMPLQPLIGNQRIGWDHDLMGVEGSWDHVFMYVKLPAESKLRMKIELQNPGQSELYLDSLKVSLLSTGGH